MMGDSINQNGAKISVLTYCVARYEFKMLSVAQCGILSGIKFRRGR